MIIPNGLTVNIGRRQYKEGDALPNNAPESIKKKVSDHIAKLAGMGKAPGPAAKAPANEPSKDQG